MRILFFTDHFRPEPSAPAAHVFERARLWVQWGHDVTVICSAPNFPEGKVFQGYKNKWRFVESIEGIKVIRVKTFIVPNQGFVLRIMDYMSYMFSAFFFSLFEKKPDVVISTSPHIFVSVAGVMYSLIKKVPHVMEVRDLWPASIVSVVGDGRQGLSYRLLERIELWLYKKSTRIISLTQSFVVDMVERGVAREKIDVVINGANLELFSPKPKEPDIEREFGLQNRFVIGYLGTIGLAHGLINVIDTARLLRDQNAVFFFVGVGAAKKQLQEMVEKEKLTNVVFADRQEKEAMPAFLGTCDLSLIHLKNADVFKTVIPSKIFEAAAMGLPILFVGPKGEGSDIVEKHGIGVWVRPDSPDDFAAAVKKLMNDKEQVREMGLRARQIAPMYSRDKQAKDSLITLKRAISGNSILSEKEDVADYRR